ncbi:MAG TPA: IPT/TIG domain-containing protein [Candidatus Acidoferrum sp.]|nr:IPT/TIG domain-containing protein [Candidatus Acidoferrum sp.]
MGRYRRGVPLTILFLFVLACAGCGHATSGPPPPPPPAPDFALSLSSSSISITQGAASSAVNVSVNAVNGFSGAVQVILNGLPAGDILDAHSGALRLRVFLPQQFLTAVDGLDGDFLATDENGQRLFAITSSDGTPQHAALTIVPLPAVPPGIATVTPTTVAAAGGTTLTIRGGGFQNSTTITINEKSSSVAFKDANTLLVTTPSLTPGPQQIVAMNPDGESVSLDAAFTAN